MTAFESRASRLAAAGVCGVLIAGLGMSAAVAAPTTPTTTPSTATPTTNKASASAAPSVPQNMTEVTNLTPYVWTYQGGYSTYSINPPQTLQPGQSAVWSAIGTTSSGWAPAYTVFTFTDDTGAKHMTTIEDDVATGETPDSSAESYSQDLDGSGNPFGSSVYHMAFDPDGYFRHFDAIWNTPVTINVDNSKDAATAAEAVNGQLPRATSSNFTVYTNADGTPKVSYRWSDYTRATSRVINESSEEVTLEKGQEEVHTESTSIGEEITASASDNVAGIATKVAASVTSDQEWGTQDKFATTQGTKIKSGDVGWITMRTDVGTVTGELVFTTPEGVTYDITNIDVKETAMYDAGNPMPPSDFQGHQEVYVPLTQH
ncbi:MAG: hypothetical protein JO147_02765 [Actinobacteria bacterium]|nr:hypothetical protein [Actinomycetota bacterium]